jgi:hypothetical protein
MPRQCGVITVVNIYLITTFPRHPAGFFIMQKDILTAALDSKFKRFTENDFWKLGQGTICPESIYPCLEPVAQKVMRISPIINELQLATVIGGLCSAMSGDQKPTIPFYKFLRMDQITETVGITSLRTLIVVEDSFFADLRQAPLPEIQKQTLEAEKRLQTWAKVTSGNELDLSVVLTSDPQIGKGLTELVKYFSNDVLQNPNFGLLQRAPVLLMYTSFWPELLTSLGKLKSPQVICLEPTNHFNDEGSLPASPKLRYAYDDFINWLKANPPGFKGRNKEFLVAGYLEAVEANPRKAITRSLPFETVPNTLNWQDWNNKIIAALNQFPFPLRANLIFAEAINWGLWNEEIVNALNQLVVLQAEYKQSRQNKEVDSAARKHFFYQKTKPLLIALAKNITDILTKVLGEQR